MNNNDIYVSLDIGTSNVRIIVGEMSSGNLNIIGVGNVKSKGLKKASIIDIDETVHSIRRAVEQAERMIGLSINQVIVGINGNHIQLQPCHGVVAVSSPDREISDEDIGRVIDAAQVISIPPEREIIDVIPKQFIVDGVDEINDPRGMIGVRLEMEGTIITGSKTVLHNLLRCVERAGLHISDICLQPLAASAVAISKDEKNLGVALVDVGGGSMTVSIFEQGTLQATSVIPVGGDHITNDIALGLRTTKEEAKRIKTKHGHAFIDEASDDELFSVKVLGSDVPEQYSQFELAHIIEARLDEMLSLVKEEVRRMGFANFPSGYVLTGGTVMLPGTLELAKEIFQANVRIAIPDYIGVREPQYINGIGLIQFAYENVKIQGRNTGANVSPLEHSENIQKKKDNEREKAKDSTKVKKKVSNWFKVFFE